MEGACPGGAQEQVPSSTTKQASSAHPTKEPVDSSSSSWAALTAARGAVPGGGRKKLRPEEAAGQKPWVEGALDCLCAGGVDQPRVLVELRELYEKDSLAAWRAVAQFRRQVAASIDKPNNYARSLISKERRQAGLWVIR